MSMLLSPTLFPSTLLRSPVTLAPSGSLLPAAHAGARWPSPGARRVRAATVGSSPQRRVGGSGSAVPFLLASVLVAVALLLAPERPHDQEAICHRHSGEVACRVW